MLKSSYIEIQGRQVEISLSLRVAIIRLKWLWGKVHHWGCTCAHTSRHTLKQMLAHTNKPDYHLKNTLTADCLILTHTQTLCLHKDKSIYTRTHTLKTTARCTERWADWSSRGSASACLASSLRRHCCSSQSMSFPATSDLQKVWPMSWAYFTKARDYLVSSNPWAVVVQRFSNQLISSWQHRCYPVHQAVNHKRCSLYLKTCVMYMGIVQTKHFLLIQLHNKSWWNFIDFYSNVFLINISGFPISIGAESQTLANKCFCLLLILLLLLCAGQMSL